ELGRGCPKSTTVGDNHLRLLDRELALLGQTARRVGIERRLPGCARLRAEFPLHDHRRRPVLAARTRLAEQRVCGLLPRRHTWLDIERQGRSEERRVGKGWRTVRPGKACVSR